MAIHFDLEEEIVIVVLLTLLYFIGGPVSICVNVCIIADSLEYLWPNDARAREARRTFWRVF